MNNRILLLQKQLKKDGLDGALYATSGNLQYFLDDTGYSWQRTPYTAPPFGKVNGHQLNVPDCVLYIPADE